MSPTGSRREGCRRPRCRSASPKRRRCLACRPCCGQSVVDLSGGEQQRVALARALAKDASVYLYDEPLSNLDAKLRHHTRRQIMDIHQRKRKPSLYVTHDQGEALAMADRIGVMAKGRLQQVGTPEQLLDDPAEHVRRPVHRVATDEPDLRPAGERTGASTGSRPMVCGYRSPASGSRFSTATPSGRSCSASGRIGWQWQRDGAGADQRDGRRRGAADRRDVGRVPPCGRRQPGRHVCARTWMPRRLVCRCRLRSSATASSSSIRKPSSRCVGIACDTGDGGAERVPLRHE